MFSNPDSTNLLPFLPAPGADDDASGTTSILSAFKSLVESGFKPTHSPVEFQWASAEEGGLLGSNAIAQDYASRGVKVRAMLQMDMTAVSPRPLRGQPSAGSLHDMTTVRQAGYEANHRHHPGLCRPGFHRLPDQSRRRIRRHRIGRNQVRLRLLRPRELVQGWSSVGVHDRIGV